MPGFYDETNPDAEDEGYERLRQREDDEAWHAEQLLERQRQISTTTEEGVQQ